MNVIAKIVGAAALGAPLPLAHLMAWCAELPKKNWTAPAEKIYGQQLCNETMTKHPELLSVTLQGVPPGMTDNYTMFAGSLPERIGNPDDPDDIDVSKKGITILDPRWKRTNDNPKKFVVLMPMRDASGENVGLVVYAFGRPPTNANSSAVERGYLTRSTELRDELAKKIPSYTASFESAKD